MSFYASLSTCATPYGKDAFTLGGQSAEALLNARRCFYDRAADVVFLTENGRNFSLQYDPFYGLLLREDGRPLSDDCFWGLNLSVRGTAPPYARGTSRSLRVESQWLELSTGRYYRETCTARLPEGTRYVRAAFEDFRSLEEVPDRTRAFLLARVRFDGDALTPGGSGSEESSSVPGGGSSSVPDSSSRLPTAGGGGGSASGGRFWRPAFAGTAGGRGGSARFRGLGRRPRPRSPRVPPGSVGKAPPERRTPPPVPRGGNRSPPEAWPSTGTSAAGTPPALRHSAGEVRRHGRRGSGALHPAQLPARCAPVSGLLTKYPAAVYNKEYPYSGAASGARRESKGFPDSESYGRKAK